MTEEGPHKLVEVMADNGYGNTKTVLGALSKREDFEDALTQTIGKKKVEKAKNTEVTVDEEASFDPTSVAESEHNNKTTTEMGEYPISFLYI